MNILNYHPSTDAPSLFSLWHETLGKLWPLNENKLLANLEIGGTSGCFVAKEDGQLVGFISAKSGQTGSIQFVVVKPEFQRCGIGTRLLDTALDYLQQQGIKDIHLGSGASTYLWPGVPQNLPQACKFFKKAGWAYSEESVDMVMDLNQFILPGEIINRVEKSGIKLVTAHSDNYPQLLIFEDENFPNWSTYFRSATVGESQESILIAINKNNQILGSVLVGKKSVIWNQILGNNVGTLGALGVKETARGQGVGLALAAKATEILKEENLDKSYLGWTWLVDWYGRLGYKVWRKYYLSHK